MNNKLNRTDPIFTAEPSLFGGSCRKRSDLFLHQYNKIPNNTLTNSQLQTIIQQLETQVSEDKANFGIFHNRGDAGESYIQANKNGLALFALELLNAAAQSDEILISKTKTIIPLDYDQTWINQRSDTLIQYVEPVTEGGSVRQTEKRKETFFEKLIPIGCFAILIVAVAAMFVGLWTFGKWIF